MLATVMLSLLVATSTATEAAAAAPAGDERGDVVQVDDDDVEENEDFEPAYFAFSTNDNLHPSIEDETMIFHLAGLLGCIGGQIWLPLLLLDEQPEDYITEALISWLIWGIPVAILSVLGPLAWIGWLLGLVVHFYIIPVNVMNAWDRSAKTNGMKEGRKKKKRRKKKQPVDEEGEEETSRHGLPEAPLAAMSY